MARLTKRTIEAAAYNGDGKARHVLWDDMTFPASVAVSTPATESPSCCPIA
jgi:hypothetical protein